MRHWGTAILAAVLFGCPWTASADVFGDFAYTSDGTAIIITDYTGAGGDVVIPDTIDGLPVTVIGQRAFYSIRDLTGITIPDTVTTIGQQAFHYCYGLRSVVLPDSVILIDRLAFDACRSLTNAVIGTSVTTIGNSAFMNCHSLLHVTIPDSATTIGQSAFKSCWSLPVVEIPESVTSIGVDAFSLCDNLSAIAVADQNPVYSDHDGVLFSKDLTTLIQFPGGRAGDYAIPEGVISVGMMAFRASANLASVLIPASVTSIGGSAFAGCGSLTALTVVHASSFFADVEGVLFNKGQTVLIQFPGGRSGTYVVPDSITGIGSLAFYRCTNLTGVRISDGVTHIGDQAFSSCENLVSLTIGKSVADIGYAAFFSCPKLTHVIIPSSVYTIGRNVFFSCSSLTSVFFAGDAPIHGLSVFFGSDNVTVYYLPGTTGWGATFADRPAVLWNPVISEPSNDTVGTGISFRISGTENIPIAVEATDDLLAGAWIRLATNTLAGGAFAFQDADAVHVGKRVYRIAAP